MDYFEKGEDIYRSVQLTIGGVATDTADFTEIVVKVYDWKNLPLSTYSFTGGTVTKELPTTDGYISFIVSRITNKNSRTGKYFYEIVTHEVDVDYPGGVRIRKFVGECYGLKYAKT